MKRDPAGDYYVYTHEGWYWVGHPTKDHEKVSRQTGDHLLFQAARNRCDTLNEEELLRRTGVIE